MPLPEEFLAVAREVNNWGRWGDDDERGTVNLVTDEVVRSAVGCVLSGRRIPLAMPLSSDGPQLGVIPGRINPLRTMIMVNSPVLGAQDGCCFSDDVVVMGLQAATHWDSLAHVSYDGRMYNGFPVSSTTASGAARCGIDKVGPFVTRGVLLDVARATGTDPLEPGRVITPEDLDAAEELAGVAVQAGDAVLLRTGHVRLFRQGKKQAYAFGAAGPGMAAARWFRQRDVAAVATDTYTFEVFPGERADLLFPVHLLHLVEMGMLQGQNFDLEALSADCADDGRYSFLLDASPQPFVSGLGSPVYPVAVK
jgi:kynurenine formamidase